MNRRRRYKAKHRRLFRRLWHQYNIAKEYPLMRAALLRLRRMGVMYDPAEKFNQPESGILVRRWRDG